MVDHPLPVLEWVPWLPAHVRNVCCQTVRNDPQIPNKLYIQERSVVTAVPIVEPVLCALWTVTENQPGFVDISVDLSFNDCNVLFLQGLIEFHACAGLKHYFSAWEPHAVEIINGERERALGQSAGDEASTYRPGRLSLPLWGPGMSDPSSPSSPPRLEAPSDEGAAPAPPEEQQAQGAGGLFGLGIAGMFSLA